MNASSQKLEALFGELESYGSTVVCFSGGIDSAFVLAAATKVLGDRAIGLTAVSPSLPKRERLDAEQIARRLGARHITVESGELSRKGYVENGPDRCFHCKSELYSIAETKRSELNFATIANGTNTDDLGDYRPGLSAAANAGAKSPLVATGFSKQDVREGAQLLGMTIWDKPAAACLSSRIPYGTHVTRERLAQIEALETSLHELGFRQVRVRYHGEVARIELPKEELSRGVELGEIITKAGKEAGFRFVALDLVGYRSGSLNEGLSSRRLPVVSH